MKINLTKGILDIKGTPAMASEGVPFTMRDALLALLNLATPQNAKETFQIQALGLLIANEKAKELDGLTPEKEVLLRRIARDNHGPRDQQGQKPPHFVPVVHAQVMQAVGLTEEDV